MSLTNTATSHVAVLDIVNNAKSECEQVLQVVTAGAKLPIHELQLTTYEVCSGGATHRVQWGEKDMHPGEMWFCDKHMTDFLADAEWCEDITWTYVQRVDEVIDLADAV
jgi:hypothetical protein